MKNILVDQVKGFIYVTVVISNYQQIFIVIETLKETKTIFGPDKARKQLFYFYLVVTKPLLKY